MSLFPAAEPLSKATAGKSYGTMATDVYILISNATDDTLTLNNTPELTSIQPRRTKKVKRGDLNKLQYTSNAWVNWGPHTIELPDASKGTVMVTIGKNLGLYSSGLDFLTPAQLSKHYGITAFPAQSPPQ